MSDKFAFYQFKEQKVWIRGAIFGSSPFSSCKHKSLCIWSVENHWNTPIIKAFWNIYRRNNLFFFDDIWSSFECSLITSEYSCPSSKGLSYLIIVIDWISIAWDREMGFYRHNSWRWTLYSQLGGGQKWKWKFLVLLEVWI